ncbi:MAG TPA: tetratricopeptide repeat protein [Methylomirabilota bacterium]|nr:tetratricopeptide repeat protein [Methylomirabilota bacterium]
MLRRLLICVGVVFAWTALASAEHHRGQSASSEGPPLFDDLGAHSHAITTTSPLAQKYFDQGLRLVYGFNHDEAKKAFEEAARLDPNCAMAYWGIALTLGPNYNLPVDTERDRAAYEAIQKALALAPQVSKQEQAYINAIARRHSADPNADRRALDRTYADAMREVAKQYPDDLDAATLFAESLMNLWPWKLWTLDGQPQQDTPEIIAVLESVLKRNPDHPGAIHYYIHAVEPSPNPERALPYAKRLGALVPGAGHLVHMPSHIYIRVGLYKEAVDSNARAAAVDAQYIAKHNIQGVYRMMYYPHNIHFQWAALMMEGRGKEALRTARDLVAKTPAAMIQEMPPLECFSPSVLYTFARFGKWDEALKEPPPPQALQFTTAIWHYVRGLALTAKGRLKEAANEQAMVASAAEATPPDKMLGDNTPAKTLLQIASHTLEGEIALKKGQSDAAIPHLETAVQLQDGLPYTEPPPWYYPVRQTLGAALLKAGRAAEAEAVYHEDLKRNPDNGWSLFGLAQSLKAQKKAQEAGDTEKRFQKAWARADVKLTASRL